MVNIDSTHSSLRESLLEHAFIGSILQEAWQRGLEIEVLRPEVDRGVDIVFGLGAIIRHLQLKSTRRGSKVARWPVNISLADKPAGAVVVQVLKEEADGMEVDHYLFLGGSPAQKLDLDGLRVAKHSKGNAVGVKLERPAMRTVPKANFKQVNDFGNLFELLFGTSSPT